ncbi:MAG: nucleoside-triphosphatase [Candidatus Rifleibacteriota bacterium]
MISIVCSDINTGKTSWLRQDFTTRQNADGFLCIKVFAESRHIGYNLLHLPTGQECQFIRKHPDLENDWQEICRIGENYSFDARGLAFAEKIAENAIERETGLFYLDEIGPLELQGKGFADLFTRLLLSNIDLMIAVRKPLLEKVTSRFALKNPLIIEPWTGKSQIYATST